MGPWRAMVFVPPLLDRRLPALPRGLQGPPSPRCEPIRLRGGIVDAFLDLGCRVYIYIYIYIYIYTYREGDIDIDIDIDR